MDGERHESRGSHRREFHTGIFVTAIVAAGVLWVVFVSSSINAHEMYVGAGCLVLTMIFVVSVARTLGLNLSLRMRDIAQAWPIPWYVATGLAVITWVLIKDLLHIQPAQNLFRVCGFDSSKHDPVRIARTVLAVAYTTMTPNSIVIGIDPAQSRMLFHQVSRTSVRPMTQRLGAKG